MPRTHAGNRLRATTEMSAFGLTPEQVGKAIDYVYEILDSIDERLVDAGGERLAELVELANLSAIIGNLFRGGIVRASNGAFVANGPHTYPDLLGRNGASDIEIKVALEKNNPKGHLIKPGPHLIVRYVLCSTDGTYSSGKENRGAVVWIWEVRVGMLQDGHFNVSNTDGDSGKTAVINADGMRSMPVVYCDLDRCPLPAGGATIREMAALFRK